MGSLCGCCRWCLLLLAGWCGGFCNVQVNGALAAHVVLVPFLLVGEVSTQYLFLIRRNCLLVCLLVLYPGVWIGIAICLVIMGNCSCIIAGRPISIGVCWVSFGAWLLGRSNYDCIRLAKFLTMLCIEIGR